MAVDDFINPAGVGNSTNKSIIEKEAGPATDVTKARVFIIIDESVRNPVTGGPVRYKLVPQVFADALC